MKFGKIIEKFGDSGKKKEAPPLVIPPIPFNIEGQFNQKNWKEVPVDYESWENQEKLVPVGPFSDFDNCATSAVYFLEEKEEGNFLNEAVNRDVSLITHFVREGILEKLKNIKLPKGYYLKFYDNFRPLQVQQALFDAQKEKFKKENPEWTEEKLDKETQKYVSLPSPNKERGTTHPSPHSTGGVVDLTIIKMSEEGEKLLKELEKNKNSNNLNYPINENEKSYFSKVLQYIKDQSEKEKWSSKKKKQVEENWLSEYRYIKEKAKIFKEYTTELNMGSNFDHFGEESGTLFYEKKLKEIGLNENEKQALENRRFLYQIMTKAGFSNYPEEWWHFSYGDNMNAVASGKNKAVYGEIELSEKNIAFEKARRGPYFNPKLFS